MAKDTGVALIQTILKFEGGHPRLSVDGVIGNQTRNAYATSPPLIIQQVRRTVKAGTGQDSDDLVTAPVKSKDGFDSVVSALVRASTANGLIPSAVVSQVVLESAWGKSGLSRNYHNYGGLKFNAVQNFPGKKVRSTQLMTTEYIDGKKVSVSDGFAVFDDVDHFADVYVWYLLRSGSAYRYKGITNVKTVQDHFRILQEGGYATDPNYARTLADVHKTVVRKYPEVIV